MFPFLYWVKQQYRRVYRHHHLLQGNLLLAVAQHNQALWWAWFEVSRRMEQNVKMWIHSCECTKENGLVQPVVFTRRGRKNMGPPPPPQLLLHFSISLPLLPFYSQHKNTLTSPQEGQAEWEQRFGAHIMLQKALFLTTVFLELPLCCLNVYMEQLGGLKTDVWSKNTASVQSLFSLDESNNTILRAFQIAP